MFVVFSSVTYHTHEVCQHFPSKNQQKTLSCQGCPDEFCVHWCGSPIFHAGSFAGVKFPNASFDKNRQIWGFTFADIIPPPPKKTLCREFDDNPRSLSGSFRLLETLSFDQTDPVSFHFFSAEAGQVVFDIIGSTYTVAFTLELVLRIWGYGCRDFFCKEDWAWSILDVFVVATSLSELVLIILAAVNQNEGESLSGITSLKAFRIIRALFFM